MEPCAIIKIVTVNMEYEGKWSGHRKIKFGTCVKMLLCIPLNDRDINYS